MWAALSRFGNPFPPFDFNSGMGVRDVAKSECRAIGLLGEDEQPAIPKMPDFNGKLYADMPMQDNALCADVLRERFGDQVRFDGNRVHFVGELMRDVVSGKKNSATLGVGFNGKKTSISHALAKEHVAKHIGENSIRRARPPYRVRRL